MVLATHVPLGREVLRRGIIFLDLAIAQIAAFGVVVTSAVWLDEHSNVYQTLVAIIAAVALTLRYRPGSHRQNPALQVRVQRDERIRIVKMDSEPRQDG